MIENSIYILLAILGVGFLIFIHELGHYFMAKREGITVEVFSIGFGKSIIEWKRGNVIWKIGIFPFGGYVKMAGTEKQGFLEPHEIEHGFYWVKPWSRIKVAAMGPIVNIIFAFLAFTLLWFVGGRNKPFSEFTRHIGWVEQESAIFESEIRPGDEITKLNDRSFRNFNDFLYGAALDDREMVMQGKQINYFTKKTKPFVYTFPKDSDLEGMDKARMILQTIAPAQYLLYNSSKAPHMKLAGSPLKDSGIRDGDRIIWFDGQFVFSHRQLADLINSQEVLLTVERNGRTFLTRVPRLRVSDLRLKPNEKAEISDWGYTLSRSQKVENLYFIPYNLSNNAQVEGTLSYIDEKAESRLTFEPSERTRASIPLENGDQILAIQGEPIQTSIELLDKLQTQKQLIIVNNEVEKKPVLWKEADNRFVASFDAASVKKIISTIGTNSPVKQSGTVRLLQSVTPIPMYSIPLTEKGEEIRSERIDKYKEKIEKIEDPDQKEEALEKLENYQNRLMLGLATQDKKVRYNPSPFVLFVDVFKETYRTLYALFTGFLSPKNLGGPVAIFQVIHYGWSLGFKEALFWLGMISLNLGIFNLLPIPMLDGGHICFSIWESITGKPLKEKTRERWIFPFIILLIGLAIYLTYNDILRIISRFIK